MTLLQLAGDPLALLPEGVLTPAVQDVAVRRDVDFDAASNGDAEQELDAVSLFGVLTFLRHIYAQQVDLLEPEC